jgi:hypothetical protein
MAPHFLSFLTLIVFKQLPIIRKTALPWELSCFKSAHLKPYLIIRKLHKLFIWNAKH